VGRQSDSPAGVTGAYGVAELEKRVGRIGRIKAGGWNEALTRL